MEAYIFVAAAAISAIIAIWKNFNKGTILASVIKGVEDSVNFMPRKDLKVIKDSIAEKAEEYGVGKALNKIVKVLTRKV